LSALSYQLNHGQTGQLNQTRAGRPARVKVCRDMPDLAMSRTVKDRAGKQSMPSVYEIIRRIDGSFDIFHNGELRDRSIPDEWLPDQLGKYGICGQEYRDARCKLDEFGKVKLEYWSGWMETRLMEARLKSKVKNRHRSKGV
jgi:hypothetical protein